MLDAQLRSSGCRLTADSARALLLDARLRDVVDRLARVASLALRAPIAMVGVVESDRLRLAAHLGVPEPWSAGQHLPVSATFCRYVVEMGDLFVVEDASRHPLAYEVARLENFPRVAYCGAPLIVNGVTVGVLSVCDAQARRWESDDVILIRDLANTLVRDIELLSQQSPDAAGSAAPGFVERRQDEARYRRLFEDSNTPLFVLASDTRFMEVNRACEELLGMERSLLHRTTLEQLAAEPVEFRRVIGELNTRGVITEAELTLDRADDRIVCLMSGTAESRDGVPVYHGALRDITQLKREQEELVRSALRDPLTAVANRIVFMDRLERLLHHAKRRSGYRFAVLFLDLDTFKAVNDTYGHRVGDQVLVAVARRLETCVREEDTVARLSGDEFAILLDPIQDVGTVMLVVDRIRESLARAVPDTPVSTGITVSIGIALSVSGYDRAEDLLHDADSAMYRAKASGRNAYVMFDADMQERAQVQRRLEDDLRDAVSRDQLAVHYHPVVELERGSVTGLEALVRWTHPERGILLPAEFIPLAEQTGLIVDIGWWMLRESCRQLRAWQLDYPNAAFQLTMSVNLSAKQFVHPALVEKIDEILAETGLEPRCLRLDLTEAVVMQNAELAATLLQQLRERGIHICIDDFGTGFSSVRRLRELPISTLKIDRSFINRLGGESDSHQIVQTIIALGRSMAIDAIAEGVETPEQLELLRQLGMRFAQGFLFSLPLDSRATAKLLQETS